MINQSNIQELAGHWRSLLLISASLVLSACVAEPTPTSSSSAVESSSVAVQSSAPEVVSSSQTAISSDASDMSMSSSESSSSESSSVVVVVSSSIAPSSSSLSSSSLSSVQSSSSTASSVAPEQVLISCDIPSTDHNLYGSGFEVRGVVVTNTTNEVLDKWTATLTFPAAINQLYGRPQGDLTTTVAGAVVKVTGTNLAVGGTVAMTFGGNYANGESSTELPDCIAEKYIPAPIVPLEPDQTGPLANGYCPLNSGLGVGSTSQHEIFVVTDDGGVAKIHEGKADFIDGVNNAIAVSAGSYSSHVCYALTTGNVQCGQYQNIGQPAGVALVDGLGKVIESVTTDIGANVCFLNDAGEAFCGSTGSTAAKVDFGGSGFYTYLNCGRTNRCCAIDSNDALVCNTAAGLPANKPDGKVVSVAGTDMGFCAVFDTGRVYCWGESGGTIGRGQGAPAEEFPVSGWSQVVLPGGATATAGGQWHNCWLMADRTVYCAGANNDLAAGGGSGVPTQIKGADGNPITDIVAVNGAKDAACATNSAGELFCWAGAGGSGTTAVKIDMGGRKIRLPLDCQ